jgi:hypothetical protein
MTFQEASDAVCTGGQRAGDGAKQLTPVKAPLVV